MVSDTAYCTQKNRVQAAFRIGIFGAQQPTPPSSVGEGTPERAQKFNGRAWRIAAIPTLWAAARPQVGKQSEKPSPQPSPTGEGAGCRRAKSSPHQPHSITHQKQPAPHSCAESEKSSLHIEKPSAGCFLMCFCRPSSFPRKRGNLNVIGNLRHGRQPESVGMAAQRHVGCRAAVMAGAGCFFGFTPAVQTMPRLRCARCAETG